MPKDIFYDFDTFGKVKGMGANMTRNNVEYSGIPVYIRDGNIIPMRAKSAYTTTGLRREDYELIIAPDAHGHASGELYFDDGDSLEPTESSLLKFSYNKGVLEMGGSVGYQSDIKISAVKLLDVAESKCSEYNAAAQTLTHNCH